MASANLMTSDSPNQSFYDVATFLLTLSDENSTFDSELHDKNQYIFAVANHKINEALETFPIATQEALKEQKRKTSNLWAYFSCPHPPEIGVLCKLHCRPVSELAKQLFFTRVINEFIDHDFIELTTTDGQSFLRIEKGLDKWSSTHLSAHGAKNYEHLSLEKALAFYSFQYYLKCSPAQTLRITELAAKANSISTLPPLEAAMKTLGINEDSNSELEYVSDADPALKACF